MVGGIVEEILECGERLWVNVKDRTYSDTCAVYVERNEKSLKIKKGDTLWWQGGNCYWTPSENKINHDDSEPRGGAGTRYDIAIPKKGYSGVRHPAQSLIDAAYKEGN